MSNHDTASSDRPGSMKPTGELEQLEAFRRFRWAVQAAYFAQRLAAHDLTGVTDQTENEKGLTDARRGLAGLGIDTANKLSQASEPLLNYRICRGSRVAERDIGVGIASTREWV